MKRFIDFFISFIGLVLSIPVLAPVIFLVWIQDFKSPFYIAARVGMNEKPFNMVKLRSMVVDADKSGVDSTGSNDSRITPIGRIIRKFKLDELTQLWNVLIGDMSLVGPRPNVLTETNLYTSTEKALLNVRPGITDFSSIVFSDEGEILSNEKDPDLAYNQLIRPWKSRLGLIYLENQSILLDIKLICFTIFAIVSRKRTLILIVNILKKINVDNEIIKISGREIKLYPFPPPGSDKIVEKR